MAHKKHKNNHGLKFSAAFTDDIVAAKLYHQSVELRIKGAWRDAGDRLIKIAEIHSHLKMFTEAACYYTEAAESYLRVDKGEALNAFQKSIKVYCDIGRFDIGGKLEQQVAYLNLYAQHWEDAAIHFRKAANFLAGDKLLDQSDLCMEKAAECFVRIGSFHEASDLYMTIAKSCVNSNLRRFNARDYLLMTILCHLGVPEPAPKKPKKKKNKNKDKESALLNPTTPRDITNRTSVETELLKAAAGGGSTAAAKATAGVPDGSPKFVEEEREPLGAPGKRVAEVVKAMYEAQQPTSGGKSSSGNNNASSQIYQSKYEFIDTLNEQYDQIDYMWRRSKEKHFIRNIIKARVHANMHEYIDHVYYWSNVRPLDATKTLLLMTPVLDIQQVQEHMQWEADEAARIQAELEAAEAQKKLRKQLGDDGSVTIASADTTGARSSMNMEGGRTSMASDGAGGAGSFQASRPSVDSAGGRPSLQHEQQQQQQQQQGGGGDGGEGRSSNVGRESMSNRQSQSGKSSGGGEEDAPAAATRTSNQIPDAFKGVDDGSVAASSITAEYK
mmetsp:Transcript_24628/g.41061  ORF Transcript_24628/g.41061 Transcript_24628/m.41061 type:complete len:556 (+) Transcript_24628:71-1738(+)